MKKYTVADIKGLVIGGFGDRYYKAGDVVSEKDFMAGIAENLAERGELIPINEEELEGDPEGDPEGEGDGDPKTGIKTEDLKKDEIIAKLKELKVDHNPADSKAVLRELLDSVLNEDPLEL
jgi:hypothetical protein